MVRQKLVVFGGTGACGAPFVSVALERGHEVRAVVRNVEKARRLLGEAEHLEVVRGDPTAADVVRDAIAGRDAVVTALASFHRPHTTMSEFTKHTIAAAPPGLRFLTYSLAGVTAQGDRGSKAIQATMGVFSPGKFGPAIQDHKRAIAMLEASELDYTLFQTATMTASSVRGTVQSGPAAECGRTRLWNRLNTRDAAHVCLDALARSDLRELHMRYR